MWAVVIAVVVSTSCVVAAARRLWLVYEASFLDPELTLRELRGDRGRALAPKLIAALAEGSPPEERELWGALHDRTPEGAARIGEQLIELDHRFLRWSRVPRVCASVASSSGLMLATWSMRTSLVSAPALGDETFRDALNVALGQAIGVVAIGAAGTVTCIAIVAEARRVAKARRAATDKLMDRLERIARGAGGEREEAAAEGETDEAAQPVAGG